MATWIFATEHEGLLGAVFVDAASMTAFGPVFASRDEAERFLTHVGGDPRRLAEESLRGAYQEWIRRGAA